MHIFRATVLTLILAGAAQAGLNTTAPIQNFSLPMFDENGRKIWHLNGSQASLLNPQVAELTDVQLKVFEKTGAKQLEIFSPAARILIQQSIAESARDLTVQAPTFSVTGRNWTWDGKERHIILRQNVRATFNIRFADILK